MAGRLRVAEPEALPQPARLVVGEGEEVGHRVALDVRGAEEVLDGELPAGEVALEGEVGDAHAPKDGRIRLRPRGQPPTAASAEVDRTEGVLVDPGADGQPADRLAAVDDDRPAAVVGARQSVPAWSPNGASPTSVPLGRSRPPSGRTRPPGARRRAPPGPAVGDLQPAAARPPVLAGIDEPARRQDRAVDRPVERPRRPPRRTAGSRRFRSSRPRRPVPADPEGDGSALDDGCWRVATGSRLGSSGPDGSGVSRASLGARRGASGVCSSGVAVGPDAGTQPPDDDATASEHGEATVPGASGQGSGRRALAVSACRSAPSAAGSLTIAGSTPKTSRIRSGVRTSAGVPSATIRPASRRTSRGKKIAASPRSWRTARIVVPSRSLRSTSSSIVPTWWRRSRWTVGSSRTRTGAAWATARASSTSCRSPSDSSRASRPSRCPTPTRSIAAAMAARSAGRAPRNGSSCGSRPSATTSSTRVANGSVACCGHDRHPPRDRAAGRAGRRRAAERRPARAPAERAR